MLVFCDRVSKFDSKSVASNVICDSIVRDAVKPVVECSGFTTTHSLPVTYGLLNCT